MADILPQLGVTGNPPDYFPYFTGVGFPVAERFRGTGDDLKREDARLGLLPLFQNKRNHFSESFLNTHTPLLGQT
jgi:hypothetical protein